MHSRSRKPGYLRREAAAPDELRHKSFSPRPNEAYVYCGLHCISYSVVASMQHL